MIQWRSMKGFLSPGQFLINANRNINMSNFEDFLRKLHQQTAGSDSSKERQDKAIMKAFGKYIVARTDEYLSFTDSGATDAEYLGDHAKKACVDRDTAWAVAEPLLKEWFDPESVDDNMKEDFFKAYDAQECRPQWRREKFGWVQ